MHHWGNTEGSKQSSFWKLKFLKFATQLLFIDVLVITFNDSYFLISAKFWYVI